jgi:WD40 repeat protein
MKSNVICFGFFIILVLVVACGVSFSHSSQTTTEDVKEKVAPEAYIKKDQPTAIYIEGKSEPVLRIENLPKEFPPHIQHPEGIGLSSKEFKLASFSPDAQRIAFTTGVVHEWVGVYELESKKVHVITWLWDTSVDCILWSPNSKYFAYTFVPPRGDHVVVITSFKERTAEPYFSNHWSSLEDYPECILIEDLEWSIDSKSIAFEIQKCKIEGLKLIKIEDAPVDTIILNAIEEDIIKAVSKKTSKVVVTYMASVTLDSSLADLVPKEDRKMVERKENWLRMQVDSRAHHQMAASENGRYKMLKTFFSETAMEGLVEATFVDSNGQEMWKGTTGGSILVSNNGKNFAAMNPIGGPVCFYDITSSSEPLNCIDECRARAFSKNGQYFVCANRILSLLNADGSILWEKNTGSRGHKKLAISEDGSYIVMVTNTISGERAPVITDKEPEVEKPRAKEQFLSKKERPESQLKKTPRTKVPSSPKAEEDTSSRENKEQTPPEKKVYLSFLRKDGSLIEQFPVFYHIIRILAVSGDGNYTAASIDSTLLFFRTEAGVLLWKYEFPDVYWLINSVSISNNAEIIALGVISNSGKKDSQRYVYLIDTDGNEIGHFPVRANFPTSTMGAVVCFSEDYQYLMVGSPDRKYIYKLDY